MSIVPGTRLGPYEVVSLLGAAQPARRVRLAWSVRFLINQPGEEATAYPITLILNWKSKP